MNNIKYFLFFLIVLMNITLLFSSEDIQVIDLKVDQENNELIINTIIKSGIDLNLNEIEIKIDGRNIQISEDMVNIKESKLATLVLFDKSHLIDGIKLNNITKPLILNINELLDMEDLMAVYGFSSEMHQKIDFRSDRDTIKEELTRYNIHTSQGEPALFQSLYSSIDILSDDRFNEYQRILIVIASGNNRGGVGEESIIREAKRNDIPINSIGVFLTERTISDLSKLMHLSESTDGLFVEIGRDDNLKPARDFISYIINYNKIEYHISFIDEYSKADGKEKEVILVYGESIIDTRMVIYPREMDIIFPGIIVLGIILIIAVSLFIFNKRKPDIVVDEDDSDEEEVLIKNEESDKEEEIIDKESDKKEEIIDKESDREEEIIDKESDREEEIIDTGQSKKENVVNETETYKPPKRTALFNEKSFEVFLEIQGQTYPIDKDEFFIGYADDNDISIRYDTISGRHCKITKHSGFYLIEDLGSTNGTYLNDVRIYEPMKLMKGQKISLSTEYHIYLV